MSSFRAQFRLYTVALIAALLGGFNVVVYTGFHSLLQQYVDGRLFGFADTLAELIEQRPELLKRSDHEIVVPRGAQVADDRMKELREVSHSVPSRNAAMGKRRTLIRSSAAGTRWNRTNAKAASGA